MCISDFEAFVARKLAEPVQVLDDDAKLTEIAAWEKFTLNRWGKNSRSFEPLTLNRIYIGDTETLADVIESALQNVSTRMDAQRVFDDIRSRVVYRAIQATQLNYEQSFDDIMQEAMAGNLTRRRWSTLVRGLNARSINQAYRDGLEDGGVMEEPDESEQESIADLIAESRGYVTELGAALFKEDKVTPAMADQKAGMWWRKTVMPAYYDGFESAARNQMMEFVGDDGDESCDDCRRLKGQRHRLKDWKRKRVRPQVDTENYDCGGWECKHTIVPVQGSAYGKW